MTRGNPAETKIGGHRSYDVPLSGRDQKHVRDAWFLAHQNAHDQDETWNSGYTEVKTSQGYVALWHDGRITPLDGRNMSKRRYNPGMPGSLRGAGALYVNPRKGKDPKAVIASVIQAEMGRAPYGVTYLTPAKWNARGEETHVNMGTTVIIHDGGDLTRYGGPRLWPQVDAALRAAGYAVQSLTGWASVVYPAGMRRPVRFAGESDLDEDREVLRRGNPGRYAIGNPNATEHQRRAAHQQSLFDAAPPRSASRSYHQGARDAHRGVRAANPRRSLPQYRNWGPDVDIFEASVNSTVGRITQKNDRLGEYAFTIRIYGSPGSGNHPVVLGTYPSRESAKNAINFLPHSRDYEEALVRQGWWGTDDIVRANPTPRRRTR